MIESRTSIVSGRSAILKLQGSLAALAERTSQRGEADNLVFFLSLPGALRKTPRLVCGYRADGALESAVLVHEYRLGPFGLGILTTVDATGRRNVFALPADREAIAAQAATRLLSSGAHAVHIAFSPTHRSDENCPPPDPSLSALASRDIFARSNGTRPIGQRGWWALKEDDLGLYLPLAKTFDTTLASIGQRTRSNLRYYRRRAAADLGCEFVADCEITRDDFIAFDRSCHYPVGDQSAGWRFDSIGRVAGPFLAGIRGRDGGWLALVGGRRQHGFVEIDWQMNRGDLPAYSLSTVLRSHLIEHEIAKGSTRLYIEGGTPQPIALSFVQERVAEMIAVRASIIGRLVKRFWFKLTPAQNHLSRLMRHEDFSWRKF